MQLVNVVTIAPLRCWNRYWRVCKFHVLFVASDLNNTSSEFRGLKWWIHRRTDKLFKFKEAVHIDN